MMGAVKTERHDEHEINEMAKKIAEQNRAKLTAMPPGPGYPNGIHPMHLARPGQPGIQNFFGQVRMLGQENGVVEEKRIDEESRKGRFGWCEFEKNYIPYIFRNAGEKYTSVRMVERKLLNKFLTVLPPDVNTCHCIRSYYITDSECKLLNEINLKHADCHFGKEAFTSKDLVVRLSDAKEFYHFLDLCYKKLVLKRSNSSDRCGFFRINGESVVPYTVTDGNKFVPLFYFEGETDHLKLKSETVDGWDLVCLQLSILLVSFSLLCLVSIEIIIPCDFPLYYSNVRTLARHILFPYFFIFLNCYLKITKKLISTIFYKSIKSIIEICFINF